MSDTKNTNTNTTSTDSFSAIDQALAKAKARLANKANKPVDGSTATEKPVKEPKTAKPKATDEEKAAKKALRDAERGEVKLKRDEMRAAKKAERDANRKPAHMSKVEKAAEKLPTLDPKATLTFNEITANFSASMVSALAAHLVHFNRVQATSRALNQKLSAGDTVRIVSGDARYIGQTGTVSKAQRIRCYVEVEGAKKPIYLFTSDVEMIMAAAVAKTG